MTAHDDDRDLALRSSWACTEVSGSQWVTSFSARAPSGACSLELEVTQCMGDKERWLRVFGPQGELTAQILDPWFDTVVSPDGRFIGVEGFETREVRETATGTLRPLAEWPADGLTLHRLFPRAWR